MQTILCWADLGLPKDDNAIRTFQGFLGPIVLCRACFSTQIYQISRTTLPKEPTTTFRFSKTSGGLGVSASSGGRGWAWSETWLARLAELCRVFIWVFAAQQQRRRQIRIVSCPLSITRTYVYDSVNTREDKAADGEVWFTTLRRRPPSWIYTSVLLNMCSLLSAMNYLVCGGGFFSPDRWECLWRSLAQVVDDDSIMMPVIPFAGWW